MAVLLNSGVCGAFGKRCRILRLERAQLHAFALQREGV